MNRKIIHIDMDAFYASVEQRDNPSLRGKPLVVGGDPRNRGVVASASYEARKFGIRSAMSSAQAQRLCPHLLFVHPHFDKYFEVSQKMREIFESITPDVEPLALDEAYLDVTTNLLNEPLAKKIAIHIKQRITDELHLTASAGVGPNKFIAKLASDMNKPNGLVVVPPERVFQFVENLPVKKFWGVGPATEKKLNSLGIHTAADLRTYPAKELEKKIGSLAHFLIELAHGRDDRVVDSRFDPKSRGTETTFDKDTRNKEKLFSVLDLQVQEVAASLREMGRPGRTITLKVKYSDFTQVTRSKTLYFPSDQATRFYQVAQEMLGVLLDTDPRSIRLMGVSVGNLVTEDEPLQLWFEF